MRISIACILWFGMVAACGSDVYQEGPDGEMILISSDDDGGGSSESGGPSGGGSDPCIPCDGGDCGLCTLEAGDQLYRCPGSTPPDISDVCHQTGAVYHSPDGGSYVCYRCD